MAVAAVLIDDADSAGGNRQLLVTDRQCLRRGSRIQQREYDLITAAEPVREADAVQRYERRAVGGVEYGGVAAEYRMVAAYPLAYRGRVPLLVADIVADEEAFAIEQGFVKASGKVIARAVALRHLEYA